VKKKKGSFLTSKLTLRNKNYLYQEFKNTELNSKSDLLGCSQEIKSIEKKDPKEPCFL